MAVICVLIILSICFALAVDVVESKPETGKRGIWSCSICTYDNDESMSACDICGVLRNPLVTTGSASKKAGRLYYIHPAHSVFMTFNILKSIFHEVTFVYYHKGILFLAFPALIT